MGITEQMPLEFTDFSGGITENFLQGDPRRYQYADNWLLTVDKKLQVRPPFVPYSFDTNYQLPSGNQRVNGMYTFINETILMAQSDRSFYQVDPVLTTWQPILGPSGGDAIQGGDVFNQTTYAEFQRQIYLTSDGGVGSVGVVPSKIYRNSSNQWVANTAGLPRSFIPGNFTNASLLARCIANANALSVSMQAHFQDSINAVFAPTLGLPVSYVNLHQNIDKVSLNYLVAQTFTTSDGEQPPSGVTPIATCSDMNSMFNLVGALNAAYTHHINDAQVNALNGKTVNSSFGFATPPLYHMDIAMDYSPNRSGFGQTPKGPFAQVTNAGTPVVTGPTGTPQDLYNSQGLALVTAATQLDDLLQKWNFHRKAVFTHSPNNQASQYDQYAPLCVKIGNVFLNSNQAPIITADYSDLYKFVNNLKYLFNTHIMGVSSSYFPTHIQTDNFTVQYNFFQGTIPFGTQCTLPDCTDLDSMYLLIYWLRNLYNLHYLDSTVVGHTMFTGTATGGTNTITTCSAVAGQTLFPVNGSYVYFPSISTTTDPIISTSDNQGRYASAMVLSVSAISGNTCTVTLDRNVDITGTVQFQNSLSKYHVSQNITSGAFQDSTTNPAQSTDAIATALSSTATDIRGWITLATELFTTMSTHILDGGIHYALPSSLSTVLKSFITAMPNPFFIPTVSSLVYAFFYSHRYTVEQNGIIYLVNGNPIFTSSQLLATSLPVNYSLPSQFTNFYPATTITKTAANVITGIPVLSNTTLTNYDTANIQMNIYRSIDGGTTFYLLAQVPNGTTTYTDTVNDTIAGPSQPALNTQQIIYTSGGVVGADQPPQSKFIHQFNGTTYYGNITDTGQYFPQRLRQSVQFAPDWAPATFYDDMEDEIAGISSTKSNLIVLCRNSLFRESNSFSSNGQGSLTHDKISDSIGCLNAKSIVKTEIGVFFAGNDGFYYTDGYQIIKISLELDKTYNALTQSDAQKRAIYGAYDKINRRIWWSLRQNPTDAANNIFYTFYLDYGVKPSGTFTSASNFGIMLPASVVFQQGVMFYGHENGFIMKMDPLNKADFIPSLTQASTLWQTVCIPYNYTSVAVDLGSTFKRKYMTRAHFVGKNIGNAAIQANTIRDVNQDGSGYQAMDPINYADNSMWGDPRLVWGSASVVFKTDGKMDLWRNFPNGNMHCDFFQMQLVPASLAVYSSSNSYPSYCYVTTNTATKVCSIITPTGYTTIIWPTDVVGYSLYLQTDGYVQGYPITAVSTNTITVSDPNNVLPSVTSPGIPWTIRGVVKAQRPSLTSYVLHFGYLGQNTQDYPGKYSNSGIGNAGENPT